MWFRRRDTYPLYRNAVLASGAIGMVIFALFPLAPPRFVSEIEVVDTVSLYSRSYRVLQPPSLTNLYAAMPSLHLGWNLLVGIAIVRSAVTLPGRALGFALPIGMFAAIVLTGNHYILDGIAGGTIALIGLSLSTLVIPQFKGWLKTALLLGTGKDHQVNTPPRGY
jgi:membrane-associated phospholipid phosphatase